MQEINYQTESKKIERCTSIRFKLYLHNVTFQKKTVIIFSKKILKTNAHGKHIASGSSCKGKRESFIDQNGFPKSCVMRNQHNDVTASSVILKKNAIVFSTSEGRKYTFQVYSICFSMCYVQV